MRRSISQEKASMESLDKEMAVESPSVPQPSSSRRISDILRRSQSVDESVLSPTNESMTLLQDKRAVLARTMSMDVPDTVPESEIATVETTEVVEEAQPVVAEPKIEIVSIGQVFTALN